LKVLFHHGSINPSQDLLVVTVVVVVVQGTSLAHHVLSHSGIGLDLVKVLGIGTHGQQGEEGRLEHHGQLVMDGWMDGWKEGM
jgi:hypothetical protein